MSVCIPPEIGDREIVVSSAVIALAEEAAAAAGGLDRTAAGPLSALGGLLQRTESVASSRIEHVYADRDEIARALAGYHADASARSTAAAVRALAGIIHDAGSAPISVASLRRAQVTLMREDSAERTWAGKFRTVQSWIGGSDFTPIRALYVPPPPDLVVPLMRDLLRATNRADGSALALAAIVHAQFESIHPFTDGNGRVGRALLNAVLRRRRLTTRTVVPVASVMLADVDAYFARLDAYREGDAEGFVGYVAEATLVACSEATETAARLQVLPDQWRQGLGARRGSGADRMVDHLLDRAVVDVTGVCELTGLSRRRAYDALDALAEAEVLTEISGGSRPRVWVVGDVLDELDDLERRIGRRARPHKTQRR